MSMYASSPDIFVPKEMPKNQEDLLRLKKEGYEKGYQIGKNDPALDDPTGRFVEMIVVVRKCMDEIKKSLDVINSSLNAIIISTGDQEVKLP